MTEKTAKAEKPAKTSALPRWLVLTITGFFGLLYAYFVWAAISFLVSQAIGPLGLNGMGWFVLLLAVVFPIAVFAGGVALGSRRPAVPFLLIMLAGLGLVGVFWLNILAYAYSNGASLVGG